MSFSKKKYGASAHHRSSPPLEKSLQNECGKDEADYLEAAGQALDGPWRREAAVGHCSKLRKVSLRRLPSRHPEAFLNLREKANFIPEATPVLEETK